MRIQVTQVTFFAGETLVTGISSDDPPKLVSAAAPASVGLDIALALASGIEVVAEPPDEDVRDIFEHP